MVLEGITTVLDGVPLLRWAWRKLLERGLEVKFHHPTYHLPSYGKSMRSGVAEDEPIFHVQVYPENPNIYCWMDCELINHRTDRQEVIQSSTLSLKRRHWYFWSRTLANAPFTKRLDDGSFSGDPLLNIRVQEMSTALISNLWANGKITSPLKDLPRRMSLEVELNMIGPIRRLRRRLAKITHDPKIVSAIEEPQEEPPTA